MARQEAEASPRTIPGSRGPLSSSEQGGLPLPSLSVPQWRRSFLMQTSRFKRLVLYYNHRFYRNFL